MGNKTSSNGCIEIKPRPGDKHLKWDDQEYMGAVLSTCNTPHGKGTMRYSDGSIYQGDFANGKRAGEGRMIYADGNEFQGIWKNGEPIGRGKLTRSEGDVLLGNFFGSGLLCGLGKHYYPSGRKAYQGNFLNGMYHGEGTCYNDDSKNTMHYQGGWISDETDGSSYYHGYGVLCKNGNLHSGYYHYGHMNERKEASKKRKKVMRRLPSLKIANKPVQAPKKPISSKNAVNRVTTFNPLQNPNVSFRNEIASEKHTSKKHPSSRNTPSAAKKVVSPSKRYAWIDAATNSNRKTAQQRSANKTKKEFKAIRSRGSGFDSVCVASS